MKMGELRACFVYVVLISAIEKHIPIYIYHTLSLHSKKRQCQCCKLAGAGVQRMKKHWGCTVSPR